LKAHSCWHAAKVAARAGLTCLFAVAASAAPTASAQSIETAAHFAYLVDLSSDTVLMEKNASAPTAPASMSKIMTVLMLFERLKAGTLAMHDTFPVSEAAWRKGGSKMFVKVGSRITVEDLLRGIIVQSGNDACIVVAEGLAGSEGAFAAEMTARAAELGLTDSNFVNATGWPDDSHVMSSRDLARLAEILIENYPEYYPLFAERSFEYNGIAQQNRNPLLSQNIGADGLKTGHTEASGYGLTVSAKRDDRRLVLVLNGLDSSAKRAREAERLLEWGFRSFDGYPLFTPGEVVEQAPVWLGDRRTVPLVLAEKLTVTLPRSARARMNVSVAYEAPIAAPIAKGRPIGALTVTAPGAAPVVRRLIAGADVEKLGPVGRILGLVEYWLDRLMP